MKRDLLKLSWTGHPFKSLEGLKIGMHLLFRESPSLRIPRRRGGNRLEERADHPNSANMSEIQIRRGRSDLKRTLYRPAWIDARVRESRASWIRRGKRFNRRMSRIATSIPAGNGGRGCAHLYSSSSKKPSLPETCRVCVRRDL